MTPSDSRPKQDISDDPDLAAQDLEDLRQAGHAPREHDRQLDSLLGLLPGSAYRALADEQPHDEGNRRGHHGHAVGNQLGAGCFAHANLLGGMRDRG